MLWESYGMSKMEKEQDFKRYQVWNQFPHSVLRDEYKDQNHFCLLLNIELHSFECDMEAETGPQGH